MTFANDIWNEVQDAIAKKVGDLNLPLSAVGHANSHTLPLSKDISSTLPSGAWSSTFTASAKASCSYDVLDAGEASNFGLTAPNGCSLMQILMAGSLSFDLNGKYPSGAFSFGADASASGDVQLTWIFAETSTKIAAEALANDIQGIEPPVNLAQVYEQSQWSTWQETRVSADGKLAVGLNLAASSSVAGASFSALLNKQSPVGVNIGVSALASWGLSGKFQLVIRRDPSGVRVTLQRDSSSNSQYGLQVGASADFSVALTDAANMLASSLPDPQKYLDDLTSILEPGNLLLSELTKLIEAKATNPTEATLAKLILGISQPGQVASTALQDLQSLLDGYVQKGTQIAAADVTNDLQKIFPDLPASVSGAVVQYVTNWINSQGTKISDLANKLVNDPKLGSDVNAIADALGAFGQAFAKALNDLNEALSDAKIAKAIRNATSDYATLRSKWIQELQKAAALKLSMTLGVTESSEKDDSVLADIIFHLPAGNVPEEADELYTALLRGKLDDLPALVKNSGKEITVLSGSLLSKVSRTLGITLGVNLLGQNLSWGGTSTASLQVHSSLFGDLDAVSGAADAGATSQTWYGNFQTSLGCQILFTPAPPGTAGGPSYAIGFKGGYTFSGQNITADDLGSIVASIAPLCKVPDTPTLLRRLGLPAPSATHAPLALNNFQLVLPIQLDVSDLQIFESCMNLSDKCAAQVMLASDAYYKGKNPFLQQSPSQFIRVIQSNQQCSAADVLAEIRKISDLGDIASYLHQYDDSPGVSTEDVPWNPNMIQARVIRKMARIVGGVCDLQSTLAMLNTKLAGASLLDSAAQAMVFNYLNKICSDIGVSAVSTDTLLGNEYRVPWELSAFAASLACGANLPLPGAYTPVASNSLARSDPVTLVLSSY